MGRIWVIARTVWLEMLRRKDVYVLLILLGVLLYALLSVNIFGLGTTVRYVTDLGLLLVWLFSLVLTVGVSCRQLPNEEKQGTIYPLLAKPLTREELLIGKWIGAWVSVSLATTLFYISVATVVKLRGSTFEWGALGQAWVLHIVSLGALAALSIALSTRFTYGAAASLSYVVIGASLVLVPRAPAMLVEARGIQSIALLIVYYLFPHFELFDMRLRVVHGWGTISLSTFFILICYGVILSLLFMFLAWAGYRNKHFQRGAVA
jgi:ABC-type transport system involved in multi-copper enzyme maturation permease subunit